MYRIIWRYTINPDFLDEFLKWYAADGEWAKFFRKSTNKYMGTDLLKSADNPLEYLTIDRWKSKSAYEVFRAANSTEYSKIDTLCERFTTDEKLLGKYFKADPSTHPN
ncbi:MAG: hypothetical protein HRU69_03685 [Flammeovirgaceae bacterium]|nr:MAG: hypothetical protein HRU69_03685 [Flammeovirgaceae bacterium]